MTREQWEWLFEEFDALDEGKYKMCFVVCSTRQAFFSMYTISVLKFKIQIHEKNISVSAIPFACVECEFF